MKYLCLACGDESAWEALTAEQQREYRTACRVHDEALAADPRVGLYAGLRAGGRIVRSRDGKRSVTDGPFVESKEIGGIFIVEADDLDEAVELAAMHPAGRMGEELGWYVAVRPLLIPEAS
ncbi:MAG TPA: YciI family protein [Longimicrobiales bacterium]|nr:YciI family protein [Longimicrobiales bacterium]